MSTHLRILSATIFSFLVGCGPNIPRYQKNLLNKPSSSILTNVSDLSRKLQWNTLSTPDSIYYQGLDDSSGVFQTRQNGETIRTPVCGFKITDKATEFEIEVVTRGMWMHTFMSPLVGAFTNRGEKLTPIIESYHLQYFDYQSDPHAKCYSRYKISKSSDDTAFIVIGSNTRQNLAYKASDIDSISFSFGNSFNRGISKSISSGMASGPVGVLAGGLITAGGSSLAKQLPVIGYAYGNIGFAYSVKSSFPLRNEVFGSDAAF